MERDYLSRRSLLQAIAATIGAAALPVGWAEIAEAARAAAQLAGAKWSLLSAVEASDIDAVTAQIIPTDDTPGAREAGVVYFIDAALATFLSQLAGDYRAQLAEFQAALRKQYPGVASFASLTSEQQVEHLRGVDRTTFFETTRLLTLLGMFALPACGGNRDAMGWKLRVTYRDHPDDLANARFLQDRGAEILEAAGALRVTKAPVTEQTSSMHLLGTCRMGNEPATSVVDKYHRSHDVPNLF
ncbi:MAG TPA: gluconate 2-dehydrogenase subunit 3 family protein, partial [Vicinamibacterales bacterium]